MIQGFKNLLPRNILADEAFNPILKKTEDFRKLTQQSTDLATSIQKVFQSQSMTNQKIITQIKISMGKSISGQPSLYFKTLYETYRDNSSLLEEFSNNIEQYMSELSSSNSSSFVNFSSALLVLQQQIKSYLASQVTCSQLSKKYHRQLKTLTSSIEAYKDSFNQAKLIYNIDEKIRRYNYCEQNYKSAKQQHAILIEMAKNLNSKKTQIIKTYCDLTSQFEQNQVIANIKLFKFMSYFSRGFCNLLKDKIEAVGNHRSLLQQIKPQSFLNMKLTVRNIDPEKSGTVKCRTLIQAISQFSQYNRQNHQVLLSAFMRSFQEAIENEKKFQKNIEELHSDFYRSLEKNFLTSLKQTISSIEKSRKKIKEIFVQEITIRSKATTQLLKQITIVLQIYLKKIWKRMERVHGILAQRANVIKLMMQELKAYSQKILASSTEAELDQLSKKYEFLGMFIMGFDEKINKLMQKLKQAYNDIIQDFFQGVAELDNLCRQFNEKVDDELAKIQQMKKIQMNHLKNVPFQELKKEETQKKIQMIEDNLEKINQFTKLKKPVEIEITEKEHSPRDPIRGSIDDTNMNMQDSMVEEGSPAKGDKLQKYREFLTTKITFLEGEELLKGFNCALADKIILQGKLYITNHRICFSSNFNAGNVFFGGTFIQIPIKDIITFQKRKNGIFFDNSISITTINGQVFFTSFFKRNQAYDLISKLTGKNLEDAFYEDDEEGDSSRVSESFHADEVQEDDLKEEEVTKRAEEIEKLLYTYPFKVCSESQFYGQNLDAYKMFRYFVGDQEIVISRKKYPSFAEYFKKTVLGHKQFEKTDFDPCLTPFLNSNTIKNTSPLFFTRKWQSTVPIASSGLPFMPKFAKTTQQVKVYIISKHKWISESEIENSGAPYTDCFKVYIRTTCESNNEGVCKINAGVYVNFHKQTMMKGIIESKTFEQSSMQINKLYDEYKKYLSSLSKQKKSSQQNETNNQISESSLAQQNQCLQSKLDQNESLVEELKSQNEALKQKNILQLRNFKIVLVIMVFMYLVTVIPLLISRS